MGVVYVEPGIFRNDAGISIVKQCSSCMYKDVHAPSRLAGDCMRRCTLHHCEVDNDTCCKNWELMEALVRVRRKKIGDDPQVKASRFELLKGVVERMWQDIENNKKFIAEHEGMPSYTSLIEGRKAEIKDLKQRIRALEMEMQMIPPHQRKLTTVKEEGRGQSMQEFVNSVDGLLEWAKMVSMDVTFRKPAGRKMKRKIANINKPMYLPKQRRFCASKPATIVCTLHTVIECL